MRRILTRRQEHLWICAFTLALFTTLSAPAGQPIRTNTAAVVESLKSQGIPICFERVHHTLDDAIRLRPQIERIQNIPENQRTPADIAQLESCLQIAAQGIPDDTVVGWKEKEIDFAIPAPSAPPEQILQALVRADPAYRWEKIGTRYLLYPKEGSSNLPLPGFSATDVSFDDLIAAGIEHICQPSKLNYLAVTIGTPWTADYQGKTYTFQTGPTDTRTALTAFCDAIGPQIVWEIRGCDPDWVNIGFNSVYPKAKVQ